MAYAELHVGNRSFEESPGLITWLQRFAIRFLREQADRPGWTDGLAETWEVNAEIDVYKILFDDPLIRGADREAWAIAFGRAVSAKMDRMTLEQFGSFIGEAIHPDVDYARLKGIWRTVLTMLEEDAAGPPLGRPGGL